MKKMFSFFFLTLVAAFLSQAITASQTMTHITYRELPVNSAPEPGRPKTAWIAGETYVRIEFPPEPGKTGCWISIINFPDKWHVNEALKEGSYWKDNSETLEFYPAGYTGGLKKLSFGRELTFMQEYGFTNQPATVDGQLCDVWDAFVDGYLATLYVDHHAGTPFQLEVRRDTSSRTLVKKIRYDKYETGLVFDSVLFEPPAEVVWVSSNVPPQIFTDRTNFLSWVRFYYQNPEPEKVPDALMYINYYKYDRAGSIAMLYFLFRDNPDRALEWIQLSENFQKSAREACLEAFWLTDTEQSRLHFQQIADNPEHKNYKYVTESLLKRNRYAITDLPVTSESAVSMQMHAYFMTGQPVYIERLLFSLMNFQKSRDSSEYKAGTRAIALLVKEAAENNEIAEIINKSSANLPEKLRPIGTVMAVALNELYEPLPIPTNTPLSTATFQAQEAVFWQAVLSDLWGEPLSEDAKELLKQYSVNLTRSSPSRYFEQEEENKDLDRRIQSQQIENPGNAALMWMRTELRTRSGSGLGGVNAQAIEPFIALYDQLKDRSGAVSLAAFVCTDRVADFYEAKKMPERAAWQTNHINNILHLLHTGGFQGFARRIPAKFLLGSGCDSKPAEALDTLYRQLQTDSAIDPWLKELISGQIKISEAWNARGSGYADTVTRDMSAEFKARLWEARKHLTKAWELEPALPEAAAEMLLVCRGESKKGDLRRWFDRSVAAQFDYIPAYTAYRTTIRPRWLGSHEKMFQFGVEALETRRFASTAPLSYLNSLYDIAEESENVRDMICAYPDLYPKVREFYEYTPSEISLYLSNTFWLGLYAWGARDYPTTADALSGAIHKYQNQILRRVGGWPMLLGEAKLAISSQGEAAKKAFALEAREAFKAAASLYEQILTDTDLDSEYVRPFVRERIEQTRILAGLRSGEWFNFMPPSDFSGWSATTGHTLKLGEWRYQDDWLEGRPKNQSARLLCHVSIDNDFELRGEFDIEQAARMGIIFGYSAVISQRQATLSLEKKSASLHWNYVTAGEKRTSTTMINGINTFHLQVWNKTVTLYINEQKVFDNVPLGKDWWGQGPGHIGIGDALMKPESKVLRYRNLQLRRLTSDPNPPSFLAGADPLL
jgi:hypothetical protein